MLIGRLVRGVLLGTLIMYTTMSVAVAQGLNYSTNQAQSSRERLAIVDKVIKPEGGQFKIVRTEAFHGTITLTGGTEPYKKFRAIGQAPISVDLRAVGDNEFEIITAFGPIDARDFTIKFKGTDARGIKVTRKLFVPVVDKPAEPQGIDITIQNPDRDLPQKSKATFGVNVRGLAGFADFVDLSVFTPDPNIFARFDRTRILAGESTILEIALFNELDLKTYEVIVLGRTIVNGRPVTDAALIKIRVVKPTEFDAPRITTVDLDFVHPEKRVATTVIEAEGGDGNYAFSIVRDPSSTNCDCEIDTIDNKGHLTQRYRLPDKAEAFDPNDPKTRAKDGGDGVFSQTRYAVTKVLIQATSAGKSVQNHYNYIEYRGPRYFGVAVRVVNGFEFTSTDTMQVSIRYDGNQSQGNAAVLLGHPECLPQTLITLRELVLTPGATVVVDIPVQIPGQHLICDPHAFQLVVTIANDVSINGVSQDLSFYR